MPEAFDDFSLLRGSPNYVAETITLPADGRDVQFRLRESSPDALATVGQWMTETIQKLGCPSDIATDKDTRLAWLEEHVHDLLPNDNPLVQEGRCPKGCAVYEAILVVLFVRKELCDVPFLDTVIGLDLDAPYMPENLKQLDPHLKRSLHTILVDSSAEGIVL